MRWASGLVLGILLLVPGLVAGTATAAPDGAAPQEFLLVHEPGLAGLLQGYAGDLGLAVPESFSFIDTLVVRGAPRDVARLAAIPGVLGLYPAETLDFNLYQSRAAVLADDIPSKLGITGANVTVAVVDSGADATHPGLAGRVRAALRFTADGAEGASGDADGHGTHVAGIIAGSGAKSDAQRNRGLAPGAHLVALDISTSFTTTNAIRAFQWIHDHRGEHNIRVVTNSWGREREDAHYDPNDPVLRASSALVADGLVVVFSAGNRGSGAASLTVEATNPDVITVGATNNAGQIETYSSRGPVVDGDGRTQDWVKPDLVAPGTHILSARSAQGPQPASSRPSTEERYYTILNGTSMAAPHVAAAAALLLSKDPTLTPFQVKDLLLATARDRGNPGPDAAYGYGLLDVEGALHALLDQKATETTQPVEVQRPFRATGSFGAAANQVFLAGGAPRLPPESIIEVPLEVAPGARSVTFRFEWSAPATSFEVHLVDDSGRHRYGPFVPKSGNVIAATVEDLPEDRTWHLEAEPRGALSHGTYDLAGEATLIELHTVTTRPAGGVAASPQHGIRNPGALGFFEEQARLDALREAFSGENLLKLGALVGLLAGTAIYVVRRKKAM